MRKRPAGLAAATALLIAIAVAVVSAATGGSPPPKAPSGKISLLDKPQSLEDRLPSALLELPVADHFVAPSAARFATADGPRRFFLVPGRNQSICLIYTSGTGSDLVSGGTCSPLAGFLGNGIYLSEVLAPNEVSVALVVPDGYERAEINGREAQVRNNVAIVPPGPAGPVRLSGNGLLQLTVEIGEQTPGE
jgi:hypothetical protein